MSTFTIVLVQVTRVRDRLVDGGNARRRNLPGVGMKLRRALDHTRWGPTVHAKGKIRQKSPPLNSPPPGARVFSQEVISQIPVESSTEAESVSTPPAVQLQVEPPPSAIIL